MIALRTVFAALLVWGAAAGPAQGEDAYRYWSYWQRDSGTWAYAKLGPAMLKATDGAIDGWRYGIGSTRTSTPPGLDVDFAAVCGGTVVAADQVRVAVVIDYGSDAGAPPTRAACAVVTKGLTRASALAAVAPLRLDQGFVCGIDAYPSSGCGEAVDTVATQKVITTPRTASSASATPSQNAGTPTPAPMTSETVTNTPAPTNTSDPSASPIPSETPSSPLSTIVTIVLGAIALLLAFRNARLQKESRQP